MPAEQVDELPEGVTAVPHGEVALRGFPQPVKVVALAGVPVPSPPPRHRRALDALALRGVARPPCASGPSSIGPVPTSGAALVAAGATELRIAVRWAQLQPRAGHWDGRRPRSAGHRGGRAPRDAGLAPVAGAARPPGARAGSTTRAASPTPRRPARWWPRYLDGVAGHLGDTVAGWFPMVEPGRVRHRRLRRARPGRGLRRPPRPRRGVARRLAHPPRPLAGRHGAGGASPWDDEWPRAPAHGRADARPACELDDLAGSCDLLGGIVHDRRPDRRRPARRAARAPGRPRVPSGPLTVLIDAGRHRRRGTGRRRRGGRRPVAALWSTATTASRVDSVFADSPAGRATAARRRAADQLRLR